MGKNKREAITVVAVDFRRTAAIDPSFSGTQGLADSAKNTIYLNSDQPERTIFGRQLLLNHEVCHLKVADLGIKLREPLEELYCDFEALVSTPDRYLHRNEKYLKKALLRGLSWHTKGHRYDIVCHINSVLGLNLGFDSCRKLAEYRPKPLSSKNHMKSEVKRG